MKGTMTLPVYRCARGSTSLESFHGHLVRFIPGTSANTVNFQAYLLDGITRWNQLRSAAAHGKDQGPLRTFDLQLIDRVNQLSNSVHEKPVVPVSFIPSVYTGELIGVEYLLSQSGLVLPKDEELEKEIDEGFEDFEEDRENQNTIASLGEEEAEVLPVAPVYTSDTEEEEEAEEVAEEAVSVDSRGIPGWDKVDKLALALINLTGISLTAAEAENIQRLYDDLLEFDKRPIRYTAKVRNPSRGRFARSKSGHVGVDAVKRCFLSAGCPASMPSLSRVVEAICIHLADKIPSPNKEGIYVSRWKLILSAYNKVRQRLLNSERLLEKTELVLFHINETTLVKWFKDQARRDEVKMLLQGVKVPQRQMAADESLLEPMEQPADPTQPAQPMEFEEATDTTGRARRRGQPPPEESLTEGQSKEVSRTTKWRRMKEGKREKGPRKVYTCKVCGKAMASEGHTQFRGQRYCPNAEGQLPKEEWLRKKKEEAAQKKREQQST